MRILITGGMGFIGSRLVRTLLARRKHRIFVVDNVSGGNKNALADARRRFAFYRADIADKKSLARAFARSRPDAVIHLAAVHFIPECNLRPERAIAVNVGGTFNVVDCANRSGARRFVFASSAAVYGGSGRRRAERETPRPTDVYGVSKLCGEEIVASLSRARWTIFRIFNVIGANDAVPHLIPSILEQAENGNEIALGNLRPRRDYLFVDDAARGILSALRNKKTFGEIINLGSGRGVSAREAVDEISRAAGRRLLVRERGDLKRVNDNPSLVASMRKAKKLLGWSPEYDFPASIRKLLAEHASRRSPKAARA